MKKNYFLLLSSKKYFSSRKSIKKKKFSYISLFPFKQIDLESGFDMNLMIFISFLFFGSLLYLNINKTMYT
jgi:hypothetical protein